MWKRVASRSFNWSRPQAHLLCETPRIPSKWSALSVAERRIRTSSCELPVKIRCTERSRSAATLFRSYAAKPAPPKNMGLHMRLLQSLAKKLNVRKMDDWYNVSEADFKVQGGGVLIDNYGSLVGTLETLYPHHPWNFKTKSVPGSTATVTDSPQQAAQQQIKTTQGRWDDINERKKFFIEAAKKLGIKKVDDWAALSTNEIKEAGGAGLLAHYNGFLGDALKDTFPQLLVDLSKFFVNQRSPAFWKDINVQRKFFKAIGDKFGVQKPEDWYQISSQQIKDFGGAILLSEYGNSLGKALRALYPDHQWDLTKISDFRNRNSHKKELATVREWVAYAEKGLLIKEMEDWYKATPHQVMKVQGSSVVPKLGGLPSVLKKVYPDYQWDMSRFVSPTTKGSVPWIMEVLRRLFPRGTAELVMEYKHPDLKYPSGEPIELEVYCPTHRFACEFKEPPQFSDAFTIGLSREEKRLEACKKLGITLIILPYWWDREADSLAATIHQYVPEAMPNPPVGAELIPPYPTHSAAIQAKVLADDWLMLPSGWTGRDPKGWWLSEKVDGVRVYWDGRYLLSQHGTRIKAPQWFIDHIPPNTGLDGELWLGRGEGHKMVSVSVNENDPAWEFVKFCVYDAPKIEAPFEIRHDALSSMKLKDPLMLVPIVQCTGQAHLDSYFEEVRQLGGDGVLMHRANSDYEHGKSTALVKMKVPQETEVRFIKKNERTCALICEQADGQKVNVRISAQMYNYDFVQSTVMTVGFDGLWESGQLRSPVFVRERDDLIWDTIVTSKKDKKMKLAGTDEDEENGGEHQQQEQSENQQATNEGETSTEQQQQAQGEGEQTQQQTTPSDNTIEESKQEGQQIEEQGDAPLSPKMKRALRMARAKQMQEEEQHTAEGEEGTQQQQETEKKRGRPKSTNN